MYFLLQFAIYIVASIALSALMNKNNKNKMEASAIDADDLTQADESKSYSLIYGTVENSGNLTWYGDFSTFNIKTKVKGLFSSSKQTVAIGYRLGLKLGFGYGQVDLLEVKSNDTTVFKNTTTGSFSRSIDSKDFYGDYEKEGGLSGMFYFYDGSSTQTHNPYFKSQVGVTNNKLIEYKGLSYAIFQSFYLGNSSTPAMFSFTLRRIPQFSIFPSAKSNINNSCNPVNVIYDLLTNQLCGAGLDPAYIDQDSFVAAHDFLYNEGFGVNMEFSDATNVNDAIAKVIDIIDGNLVLNKITESSAKLTLTLNRNNYDTATLPVFDETNVISVDKKTSNTEKTVVNQVVLSYRDINDSFKTRTINFQNEANIDQIGQIKSTSLTYNEIGNEAMAQKILFRKAMTLTQEISFLNITVDRSAENLEVGNVVMVNLPKYKTENKPFRITEIDFGTALNNKIKINLIEDTQKDKDYIYSNSNSQFQDINYTALNASSTFVEAPYKLATISDADISAGRSQFLTLIKRPNGLHTFYNVLNDATQITETDSYTPVVLTSAIAYRQDSVISLSASSELTNIITNTDFLNDSELRAGLYANLVLIKNGSLIEFCSFSNISSNSLIGVKRGLFNTVPQQFSVSSEVYFIYLDYQLTNTSFLAGTNYNFKTITMTPRDTLLPANAITVVVNPTGAARNPNVVSNLKIRSTGTTYIAAYDGVTYTIPTGDINFTYSFRNKNKAIQFYNDDVSTNTDAVTVNVEIYNDVTNTLITTKTSTVNNISFTNSEEISFNTTLFTRLRFVITVKKDTYTSDYKYTIITKRS